MHYFLGEKKGKESACYFVVMFIFLLSNSAICTRKSTPDQTPTVRAPFYRIMLPPLLSQRYYFSNSHGECI